MYGIWIDTGATPDIHENNVRGSAVVGIAITGAGPIRSSEQIASTEAVEAAASGSVRRLAGDRGQRGLGNAYAGIAISGAGTQPLVRANRLHDGGGGGIWIFDSASPRIEDNEVSGNVQPGVAISVTDPAPHHRQSRP